MFCLKCGEAIPDGSTVCPKCGAELNHNEIAIVYASQKEDGLGENNEVSFFERVPKAIWIVVVAVLTCCIAFLLITSVQKTSLSNDLQKNWVDTYDSILKILEFNEDTVEYRLETGYRWMDTTLFKNEYKVISGNKIQIKMYGDEYSTYTIEFNDDKTIMTITPAVTSTDSSEKWYNIDY